MYSILFKNLLAHDNYMEVFHYLISIQAYNTYQLLRMLFP